MQKSPGKTAGSSNPFKVLQEGISELRQSNPELFSEELTAEDVVNTDSNVIARGATTTDIEILQSANLEEQNEIDEDDGIKIYDEPVLKPNSTEVRNALETVQNLCPYQEKANDILDLLKRFESLYVLDITNARKQSSILTFSGRK